MVKRLCLNVDASTYELLKKLKTERGIPFAAQIRLALKYIDEHNGFK